MWANFLFFNFFIHFLIQINIITSLIFFVLVSVLLAAVHCDKMLCKQDPLLQNFQNFKIIFFFSLIGLGKNINRVG